LFQKMGYTAYHNVKRVGRSGANHQIDILVEYICPLHTSQIIIEAKSYDSPINKDRIMKLIQIVDDLGADRGILVTTSRFTPEAIKTAEGHNIDLWDREKLVSQIGEIELFATEEKLSQQKIILGKMVVKPNVTTEQAEEIIKNKLVERARGGFLGKGKIIEELEYVKFCYYPYFELDLSMSIYEEEKTGWRNKRKIRKTIKTKVDVNALNGDIVSVDSKSVSTSYSFLKNLSDEEVKIYKLLRDKSRYDTNSIVGFGFSRNKARSILSRLKAKGVVDTSRGKRGKILYKVRIPFPVDPRNLGSISDSFHLEELSDSSMEFIEPNLGPSDVIKRIESYWNSKVENISVVYYPRFICGLKTQDGSKRYDVIDGVSGELREV